MKKIITIILLVLALCGCSFGKKDKYFLGMYRRSDIETGAYNVYTVVENIVFGLDATRGRFLTLEEATFFKARLDSLDALRK